MADEAPRRGRGRPPGRRNGPSRLTAAAVITPPTPVDRSDNQKTRLDYRHADLDTLCARQLSLIDYAQQALRNEFGAGFQSDGRSISGQDIQKLMDLGQALVRSADALKRSTALAEEIADKLSPEQLLEAAIKKIEAQDLGTIKYIIRRLTEYRRKLVPHATVPLAFDNEGPAVNAIAALAGGANE